MRRATNATDSDWFPVVKWKKTLRNNSLPAADRLLFLSDQKEAGATDGTAQHAQLGHPMGQSSLTTFVLQHDSATYVITLFSLRLL